jgi:predicted phage-related endonuclease
VSPWQSPFSLWHEMKGLVAHESDSAVKARGRYLEDGIVAWWRDQHPEFEVAEQYYATIDVGFPAGATLDGYAVDHGGTVVVLEVKTAARADEWGTPGTDEIPVHYLTQVYWQLAMTRAAERAYVAVLKGPGLELAEYVVERDAEIEADLIDRCRAFYESLSADDPPPLDSSVATIETLRALHPDIDRGQSVSVSPEIAREYAAAVEGAKRAAERERGAKAAVLAAAERAQYVEVNGLRIARRQPSRSGVSLVKTATAADIEEYL